MNDPSFGSYIELLLPIVLYETDNLLESYNFKQSRQCCVVALHVPHGLSVVCTDKSKAKKRGFLFLASFYLLEHKHVHLAFVSVRVCTKK